MPISLHDVVLHLGAAVCVFASLGVFATFIGYPLLLRITTRPQRLKAAGELPSLRLLIPVHNEADKVDKKLRDIFAQGYPPDKLDIVVVDDGSTDGTAQCVLSRFGDRVRVISLSRNRGKNQALNFAMKSLAPHPTLVGTTDVDTLMAPGALERLALAASQEGTGLAAARLVYEHAPSAVREQQYFGYESLVRSLESRDRGCVTVSGSLEVHRADAWRELPPSVATDMGTALAVLSQGKGVVVVDDAVVRCAASERNVQELRRKARTIRRGLHAAAWAWRDLGPTIKFRIVAHKIMRYCTGLFQLAFFGGSLALAHSSSNLLTTGLLAAQAALYIAVLTGAAIGDKRTNRVTKLFSTLYYAQSVFLISAIELLRFVFGKRTATVWAATEHADPASIDQRG